jgi:hypothetical protein
MSLPAQTCQKPLDLYVIECIIFPNTPVMPLYDAHSDGFLICGVVL